MVDMMNLGTWLPRGKLQASPELVSDTFGFLGIRESGKSCAAKVLAEELVYHQRPWVALDPAGNWWGLRAGRDGKKRGGLPIVVVGGERGDIPFDRNAGAKIAEAAILQHVFLVVDLKFESKSSWRIFVRDFARTLMLHQPDCPWMIFLEEAAEFVPQQARGVQAETWEAVERMVRLGGNWGYGAALINQRSATISKDVLSQVETLAVLRTQGMQDRKAIEGWAKSKGADETVPDLSKLGPGQAYIMSPRVLERFGMAQFRKLETFHPREARKRGVSTKAVQMTPVENFVTGLKRQLTKLVVTVPEPASWIPKPGKQARGKKVGADYVPKHNVKGPAELVAMDSKVIQNLNADVAKLKETVQGLEGSLTVERKARQAAEARVAVVRKHLAPEFEALRKLFDKSKPDDNGAVVDRSVYDRWLALAGRAGAKRMLETLIQRPNISKTQLGTLIGVASGSRTFRAYLGWLKRNRLVEVDVSTVKLLGV